MAAKYKVNNTPRGAVPRITVDRASDYPDESTERHEWGTTYANFSTPEGRSEPEEPQSLEQRLWEKAVQHGNSSMPSFWPPSVWKRIVTKQAIANEILESLPGYDRNEAESIAERVWQDKSGKCVQIFTILVLIDKVEWLVEHILGCRHGVRDHDLPLILKNRQQRGQSSKLCRRDSETVCCFSRWRTASLEQFEKFQRRLTVPVFRLDRRNNTLIHLDLDAKDILPWCDEAEVLPVNAMSGGSGTVIRVKIHPSCHEFHDTLRAINVAGGFFAVKRLRKKTFVKFKDEVDALKRFNGKIHPHLVTLLATFTQAEYYHMIFPWAECDLDQYWEDHPVPYPGDAGLVSWLSRQCLGIMEAVSVIHNLSHLTSKKKFGRHGDIKAENILWFKSRPNDPGDRGILVISDLGLTAINSDKSRSMQPNTGLKMTPSYRPPECDIKGGIISRSFDIWTLGCLYLELVCWLLRGYAGKAQFDEARSTTLIFGTMTNIYFDIQERKNTAPGTFVFKVKDVVSRTISELHDHPYCSQWVHDLLDLIENDMLVVQSTKRRRMTSQALLERIRQMDNMVQSSILYSTGPAPQNRTPYWRPQIGTPAELNEAAQKNVFDHGVGTYDSDRQELQQLEDLVEEHISTKHVNGPAFADNMTDYSTSLSLHPENIGRNMSAIIEDLVHMVLQSTAGDPNITARLAKILPDLLKSFALMIGHCTDTPLHRDIMYFVHKHRDEIVNQFRDYAVKDEDHTTSTSAPGITWTEKVDNWRNQGSTSGDEESTERNLFALEDIYRDEAKDGDDEEDENEGGYGDESEEEDAEEMMLTTEELSTPRDCLVNSSAYHWLRHALTREILLAPAVPNIRGRIRHEILCSLSPIHVSRRRDAQSYAAIFEMDWDPWKFTEQQKYDEASSDPIGTAITLTASSQDAQALTARQYLSQVWPTIGEHVMRVIQGVFSGDWKEERYTTLPDKTTVTARSFQSTLMVIVHGSATSIAELGELLSWLGAALQPSPQEDGIVYCTPHIKNLNDRNFKRQVSPVKEVRFKIGFEFTKDDAAFGNGKCWHSMFRNPVVVRGYPIAKRATTETGLEMSLDMMACMVRAKRIVPFGGTYYFKGFSSMLALVAQKDGIFVWHHLHKAGGQHISYFDHKSVLSNIPTHQQLEKARHLVGWCPEIKFYAGRSEARSLLGRSENLTHQGAVDNVNYAIESTALPRPHSTCVLDRVSISGGKVVSGGVGIRVGVAQTPVHISRDTYFEKMNWIAKRYAILWDEEENRGWMVNGPSALLHLVLASLHNDLCGKLKSKILFRKESLELPKAHHTANSALEVLMEQKNKELKIHIDKVETWTEKTAGEGGASLETITKTKTTFTRFEDRVEKIYCLLEQVMEHQTSIEGQDGLNLKVRVRKYLEGWEFRDFATGEDFIFPRVKTLQTMAKGWVDFTREINAITIFGKGFGEIIRPADANSVCGSWARQPSQKYYLAACLSDLKDAPEIDFKAHEVKVGKHLVWKVPDGLFKPCKCASDRTGKADHSHLVQVLAPQRGKHHGVPRSTGEVQLSEQGAVIFGYNSTFPWRWKDEGDPEEEDVQENEIPEPPRQEVGFHDSAIGSTSVSVTPSGRDEQTDSTQLATSTPSRTNSRTRLEVDAMKHTRETPSSRNGKDTASNDSTDSSGDRNGERSAQTNDVQEGIIANSSETVPEAAVGGGRNVQGMELLKVGGGVKSFFDRRMVHPLKELLSRRKSELGKARDGTN